jgi:ABC-type transport system involved in cytochrome c biogenesis permease subunit
MLFLRLIFTWTIWRAQGPRKVWAQRLPALDVLDQLSYRLVAFVFPLWTFSVIAGAIWAESAWGRYWGWDPKETWAFITWVAYAAYLHARVTAGWRGRRAAWLMFTCRIYLLI